MSGNTKLIVELRERTGAGIMSCKKALVEADWDLEKAYDAIRAKFGKSAESKANRSATEGKIGIQSDAHRIAIVGVNCETDFVANGDDFQAFVNKVVSAVFSEGVSDLEALKAISLGDETVEAARVELVGRVGENIQLSSVYFHQSDDQFVSVYSHGDKVACAVLLDVDNAELGKDIGMHVVAMSPLAVSGADVPQEIVEREKAIFVTQAQEMSKPELVEKIVAGKVAKFLKEKCLLDQAFVKDTTMTINEYLAKSNARVLGFKRVELS
ncbi:translation elongation factor Ts [Candidatus Synchoanobacter obligatus]|uniref:Elongation factor Ts n=1 Tax=Candidatus Synchoanobacter obligatus TaxID=2919597 RepID=A0ABT1L5T8_9GAMM|nr:translation elongation factor Ts [Candidatus Synchoanobacter obligatus]MCP8352095.1 translation elongation factor Ts [Candidatus Synchoanobacter obligatus]